MITVHRFFRKYLFSAIGIIVLFLLLNCILIVAITIFASDQSTRSVLPIGRLAKLVTVTDTKILTKGNFSELLHEQNAWAMMLNDHGEVIWEEDLPAEIPLSYTVTQVAQFSRWYLKDYPVRVWKHPAGLFVIGYPKHSIIKYSYTTDKKTILSDFIGITLLFLGNIFLILFLFYRNTRRVEKAVSPILTGIETIVVGNPIHLPEHGELSEIKEKLNMAARQLIKKESARAEWISGISHDIRTPLSIILGYSTELEDDDTLPSQARAQARIIRKQGERLRKLVINLNLASRLEYSMQPVHRSLLSPVELARQVMSNFLNNGLTEAFELDLQTDSDVEKVVIEGDIVLLERMFDNLIQNSITHNPNGCNIMITISNHGIYCEISVQDTGIGVPLQLLKRLNSKNMQSFTYNTSDDPSHGLGLKLVHQIVKVHKGNVVFANLQPHGLHVKITLPIKDKVKMNG